MPPVSTSVVDDEGAKLIEKWILSLPRKTAQQYADLFRSRYQEASRERFTSQA